MKTYRQAITEVLPEPYASLAISRMDPCKVDRHVSGRIVGSAFLWSDAPEGHGFWEAVQTYAEGRGQLPPIPLESRILTLESRIAFLESQVPPAAPVVEEAATRGLPDVGEGYVILRPDDVIKDGDEIWLPMLRPPQWDTYLGQTVGEGHARRPVPVYPTTPLPDGYDKWVCRGTGWKSEDVVWFVARNVGYDDPFGARPERGTTSGYSSLEYWEAVREHPRYRLLVPGEVIRYGDEGLAEHSSICDIPDTWAAACDSLGDTYDPDRHTVFRRAITDYTDAP